MRLAPAPFIAAIRATVITVPLMIIALMVVGLRPLLAVAVRAAAAGVLLPDLLLTVAVAARAIRP